MKKVRAVAWLFGPIAFIGLPAHAGPVDDGATDAMVHAARTTGEDPIDVVVALATAQVRDLAANVATNVAVPFASPLSASPAAASVMAAVPEPVPAWLMAIGLAASFIGRRLRSRLKRRDRPASRRA